MMSFSGTKKKKKILKIKNFKVFVFSHRHIEDVMTVKSPSAFRIYGSLNTFRTTYCNRIIPSLPDRVTIK
jgi:hypothetical protein